MTIVNIVIWGTQHSTADWVYTRRCPVYFGKSNFRSSQMDVQETNIGFEQFCRIWSYFSGFGLRMDRLLALDFWDIVIEVLRTTKDNIQPKHASHKETGAVSDPKTKTQQVTRKQKVDELSEVDHVPTNTFFSRWISVVHLWRQRRIIQTGMRNFVKLLHFLVCATHFWGCPSMS